MATGSSLLPGESHGQRSLAGSSPWGLKEWDATKHKHKDHLVNQSFAFKPTT